MRLALNKGQADENLFEPIPEMYYPKQSPYFWTKDDQGSLMESFSYSMLHQLCGGKHCVVVGVFSGR